MGSSINEKSNEKAAGSTNATSAPEDVVVDAEGGDASTPGQEGEIEGSWSDYKVIETRI